MQIHPGHDDGGADLLERYLDGLLSEGEREIFETRVRNEPELRGQIELQRELRVELSRLYDADAVQHAAAGVAGGRTARGRGRHRRLAWLVGIAAVLAVVAGVVWSQNPAGARSRDRLLAEYQKVVGKGFVPAEVCTTDEEFIKWTGEKLKHPLRPVHQAAGASPAVTLVGWDHTPIFSYYSGMLLARVDGQPVLVVMDSSVTPDMMPTEKRRGQPRLFAQCVSGVWMFEITPLDKPTVIPTIAPVK